MREPKPIRSDSPSPFVSVHRSKANEVFGVAVSRLHALIVIGRLKRKGIAVEAISALSAPGLIPDGIVSRGTHAEPSFFRSDAGLPVEVAGPLQNSLSSDGQISWENGLTEMGVTDAQISIFDEAIKNGHVLLCIESALPSGLNIILGVLGANSVEEVVVTSPSLLTGARAGHQLFPALA